MSKVPRVKPWDIQIFKGQIKEVPHEGKDRSKKKIEERFDMCPSGRTLWGSSVGS